MLFILKVMVFIVGTPEQPRCGFTRAILQILNERNVKYDTYNVMADDDVCEGLKVFSNWPTYPQVYINGKLIGGLDIVKELIENGEFEETFPKADSLEDRLKSLITKSDIMLFMKGDPDTPRCGFSKQAIELLNSKGVKYETFDILSDEDVRQGLKEYSKWPTYPQLYVKGNLVGGIDIMKELESSGELGDALNP